MKGTDTFCRAPEPVPQVLYKYLRFDPLLENLFSGKGIKFTNPLEFNDPLENRFTVRFKGTRREIERHFRRVALANGVRGRAMRRAAAAKAASEAMSGVYAGNLPTFPKSLGEWGVLSLSARRDSTLMWSHYAEDHKGVCVGFNTDFGFFRIAFGVRYSRDMPVVDTRVRENGVLLEHIMATKAEAWSYEHEYRCLKRTMNGEEIANALVGIDDPVDRSILGDHFGPGLYPFDRSAIAEIVFGVRCSEETEATIRTWARAHGLIASFHRAVVRDGVYELAIVDA